MTKKLLIIFFLTHYLNCSAIEGQEYVIQQDSINNKNTVQINKNGLTSFFNGIKNGINIDWYISKGNLSICDISLCKSEKLIGSITFYHENGVISELLVNILPNTDFIGAQVDNIKDAVFPYQSYCYRFDNNGMLKSEGWMILSEEYWIDYERVGTWKYYKSDGEIDIVDFSDLEEKRYSRTE